MPTAITPTSIPAVNPKTPIRYQAILTGAAAIDHTVTPQDAFRIVQVLLHLGTAPTTSENFVVKIDANAGSAYDVVVLKRDLSVGSIVDLVWEAEENHHEKGDVIAITWTNTDTKTYGLKVIYELV